MQSSQQRFSMHVLWQQKFAGGGYALLQQKNGMATIAISQFIATNGNNVTRLSTFISSSLRNAFGQFSHSRFVDLPRAIAAAHKNGSVQTQLNLKLPRKHR